MHVPTIEWHEAGSLKEAASLLTQYAPDARFLAGGTDLLVDLKTGRIATGHLVSLNRIEELRGVTTDEYGLCIGALTTPNELGSTPVVQQRFSPLLDAISEMAAPQVRNMATVGGNIASAIPSADLPPILMVMNATIALWSNGGERTMPLEHYFTGPRQSVRKDSEVLTRVFVPFPPAGFGAAYSRFALRAANACAVAGVAASLKLNGQGTIDDARITLCAVASTPKLVEAAGDVLVGRLPDESAFMQAADAAMKATSPISDVRGSAEFRRDIVGVLTVRALNKALSRAREAGS